MDSPAEQAAGPQPIDLTRREQAEEIAAGYPRWRVWHDMFGWYASRKGSFRQLTEPGAPLHSVHSQSPTGLRTLLEWQDPIEPADGWDI